MVRRSVDDALAESSRRVVEQRTRHKRLLIEAVMKNKPDSIAHIYDHCVSLGVLSPDEKNAVGPAASVVPASAWTHKQQAAREDKKKAREQEGKIPSKYCRLEDLSSALLRDRIIKLRPSTNHDELERHFTMRGRPEITKKLLLRYLEAMTGGSFPHLSQR